MTDQTRNAAAPLTNPTNLVTRSADPLRRLGAMLYDSLLVIAVLIVATAPFLLLAQRMYGPQSVLIPREVGALAYVYWCWQLGVTLFFFGIFWTRKGQTLGMRAWRLRIETHAGALPSWRDATMRMLWATILWMPAFIVLLVAEQTDNQRVLRPIGFALLGLPLLNYLAAWFDATRRSVHDRFLQTHIVWRR